jgi:hypothetical protein
MGRSSQTKHPTCLRVETHPLASGRCRQIRRHRAGIVADVIDEEHNEDNFRAMPMRRSDHRRGEIDAVVILIDIRGFSLQGPTRTIHCAPGLNRSEALVRRSLKWPCGEPAPSAVRHADRQNMRRTFTTISMPR